MKNYVLKNMLDNLVEEEEALRNDIIELKNEIYGMTSANENTESQEAVVDSISIEKLSGKELKQREDHRKQISNIFESGLGNGLSDVEMVVRESEREDISKIFGDDLSYELSSDEIKDREDKRSKISNSFDNSISPTLTSEEISQRNDARKAIEDIFDKLASNSNKPDDYSALERKERARTAIDEVYSKPGDSKDLYRNVLLNGLKAMSNDKPSVNSSSLSKSELKARSEARNAVKYIFDSKISSKELSKEELENRKAERDSLIDIFDGGSKISAITLSKEEIKKRDENRNNISAIFNKEFTVEATA